MAKTTGRLTAVAVSKLTKQGLHHDGAGLYLKVTASGSKSWVFRYMLNGQARAMGLGELGVGPNFTVSLADARIVAAEQRKILLRGDDPIESRNAEREAKRVAAAVAVAKAKTFSECAEAYIEAHRAGWRNAKHADQWSATLKAYAEPTIGNLPVSAVDTPLVLEILKPIWNTKPETASRVRGRIEAVLDYAKVAGYRQTVENPARWKGHLDQSLPARKKVRKVQHHPALPYQRVGEFMAALGGREGMAPLAFQFLILTAGRSGEVLGARWSEIDEAEKVWIIPPERMKGDREHRVPLTAAALAVLERAKKLGTPSDYIFPGARANRPLSNMALEMLIRRMNGNSGPPTWRDHKGEEIVPHGCRSAFRDFCGEQTAFPAEVAEAALAHAIADRTAAAYARSDLFERRRKLMDAWGKFCAVERKPADVVDLDAARRA